MTPILNNGIFLRDTTFNAQSHIDSYHLMNVATATEPTDLGPIDIWAMAQKVEMPLYSMANFNGGKNVIEVDNIRGEYKWELPVLNDLPYVIEDLDPSNTTKGIDGQAFDIKLSQRFGHGDIITYDKYNGAELYITDQDIRPMGDAYIINVRLVNNSNTTYLDNQFLASGTKFFRVGSARGEYGQRYSDLVGKAGFREFYNFVGNSNAHYHYSVSQRAALLKDQKILNGKMPITEIWQDTNPNRDPSIVNVEGMLAQKNGKQYMKKGMNDGTLVRSYITEIDKAGLTKIAKDIETYLMWGKGGRITQDGADDIRLSTGLWKQLDSAFKTVYNKSNFSLKLFRNAIYNFLNGKVEFDGPDPQRVFDVQTGIAGMQMINELLKLEAAGMGLVINAAENNGVGAIQGQGMNLSLQYAYVAFTIPFLAKLRFKINPAFDNVNTNDIENPIIEGYPLSSYSFILFDVTDNTDDNICLLKRKGDPGLMWRYINGTMDFQGKTSGFQSSGNFSGFQVYMEQAYPALFVKDPTKLLKIVMKNPITGFSL
jgi:hypothetical protein